MRKLIYICAVFLLFGMLINTEKVSAASLKDRPTVTVLPYTNKAAVSIRKLRSNESENAPEINLPEASLVTDMVIEQLVDSGRFRLVERERVDDVLNEYITSLGGNIDPSTVLKAGKQLGVQFVIAGSISGLSTKDSGIDANVIKAGAGFNKMAVVANVTMRFIDVETHEIVLTASGVGESARTNAEFKLKRNVVDMYETDYVDASGYEVPIDKTEVSTSDIRIKIGGQDYSLVQVRNALYKAVGDMIYNKNFGVLAKMDGQSKRRKV